MMDPYVTAASCLATGTSVTSALRLLRADLTGETTSATWPRGVIGAFGRDGEVQYGYPEIAGYWLRWASRCLDVSDCGGGAVIAWLQARGDEARGWPTRVPTFPDGLDPHYSRAQYLFDHCMLWDGVQRWGQARDDAVAVRLAAHMWRHLQTFTRQSSSQGLRLVVGRGAVQPRWSAQVGPFLLKVCARVKGREGVLANACAQAIPGLIELALASPHACSHPQLYAIEGMLELGYDAEARDALTALIAAHGGLLALRESIGQGPRRCDVLAQALRVVHLCGLAPSHGRDLETGVLALAGRIDTRGRLPFSLAYSSRSYPTWASLFAEQALSAWNGVVVQSRDIV